jgi:hypothetical protein
MAASDIMPRSFKNEFLKPYRIKAVPCIVLWVVLQFRLWRFPLRAPQPARAELMPAA